MQAAALCRASHLVTGRPQSFSRFRLSPGGDTRPREVPSCQKARSEVTAAAWRRGFTGRGEQHHAHFANTLILQTVPAKAAPPLAVCHPPPRPCKWAAKVSQLAKPGLAKPAGRSWAGFCSSSPCTAGRSSNFPLPVIKCDKGARAAVATSRPSLHQPCGSTQHPLRLAQPQGTQQVLERKHRIAAWQLIRAGSGCL